MLTVVHTEMLFVLPIHQPIIVPPTVRVEMLSMATRPQITACSGFLAAFGTISCRSTRGVPESRRQSLLPRFQPRWRRV